MAAARGQLWEGEWTGLFVELWKACAGPLAAVPAVGERVFYFPQGHIEQVRTTAAATRPMPGWGLIPPFDASVVSFFHDFLCLHVWKFSKNLRGFCMLVYDRCELSAVSGYWRGVTRFGGDLAGVLPLDLGNFELAAAGCASILNFRPPWRSGPVSWVLVWESSRLCAKLLISMGTIDFLVFQSFLGGFFAWSVQRSIPSCD